jgi:uncharacterized membrane protein YfcA
VNGQWDLLVVGIGALVAGMVNAVAGGGTLITFPMLTALGVPLISASVTNTVALCPGYLGGALAQAKELRGQTRLLWLLVPAALIGGLSGGALLLNTEEKLFRAVVPFLVLGAAAVTALQGPLRGWIARRNNAVRSAFLGAIALVLLIGLAGIYGGYFNAALSIIVLAVLGLALDETFTRLNAIKQVVSFTTTSAAAVFFLFSGQVLWVTALMMALAALAGGVLGGRLATYVDPAALRWCVVAAGTVVGFSYLLR